MAPKLLASALLSALALTTPHVRAAADVPLEVSLVRGGAVAADPIVNGHLVYIPTGRVLATWDYTDPAAPLRVATSATADGAINGLARHDDHLYASWRGYDGSSGVASYSLADPAKPALVGQLDDYVDADEKFALGIAVANDHLYLFDNNNGVFVSDLADPDHPVFTQSPITSVPTQYTRVTAAGNTIYGSGRNWIGSTVLDIYDVANPEIPVLVADHGVDGIDNFSLAPEPGLVIGTGNSLTLYDIGVPTQMTKRGWLDIPPAITGVHVGDYAYTFGWGEGLDVWNIADIDAPTAAGHLEIAALAGRRIVRMGDTLLMPTDTDLMHAIDVSAPEKPVTIATGWLPGGVDARDIALHDGHAVLLQPNSGLTVNDAQTLAPTARFEADLPASLQDRSFEGLAMAGDTAWLAAWGYGLIGVDLSSPAAPQETGRVSFPFASVIATRGEYAYVARWTNEATLAVADISDPAAPTLVAQTGLFAHPYRLQVDGQYLYLAEGQDAGTDAGGLRVYDLADPAAPTAVARAGDDQCTSAFDIAIDSALSLAYLACGGGVEVIDIANPAAPVVAGRWASGNEDSYTHVARRGDRVWFADTAGVHELDVSDPTAPVRKRLTPLGHQGVQRLLATADGRLFALGGGTGVHVLTADDSTPEATPLQNKVPLTGLTGAAGDEQLFAIDVPAGVATLSILAYGGSGDISLLAKRDAVPTNGDADSRSTRPGNSETIRFNAPAAGTYYIKVIGVKAFKGVSLQARY